MIVCTEFIFNVYIFGVYKYHSQTLKKYWTSNLKFISTRKFKDNNAIFIYAVRCQYYKKNHDPPDVYILLFLNTHMLIIENEVDKSLKIDRRWSYYQQ